MPSLIDSDTFASQLTMVVIRCTFLLANSTWSRHSSTSSSSTSRLQHCSTQNNVKNEKKWKIMCKPEVVLNEQDVFHKEAGHRTEHSPWSNNVPSSMHSHKHKRDGTLVIDSQLVPRRRNSKQSSSTNHNPSVVFYNDIAIICLQQFIWAVAYISYLNYEIIIGCYILSHSIYENLKFPNHLVIGFENFRL